MRVAFLSDVHANLPAFGAALERAKRWKADEIHLLGDLVNGGPHPKEVVEIARKRQLASVAGNHDRLVTGVEGMPNRVRAANPEAARELDAHTAWTLGALAKSDLAFLAGLPLTRRVRYGRFLVMLAHASPESAWSGIGPRAPDAVVAAHLDHARADVLVVGHTHVAEVRRLADGRLLLNPGGVGRSQDGPEATLILADFEAESFEVEHVAYDVEEYRRDSLKAGLALP